MERTIETLLKKFTLMRMAVERDGMEIEPCQGKTWSMCFEEFNGWLYLWYNVPSHTTKIVKI